MKKENRTSRQYKRLRPAAASFKLRVGLALALLSLVGVTVGTGFFRTKVASAQGLVPNAPPTTTINEAPLAPHSIIAFPSRDFISAEGYDPANGPVTVNVLRDDDGSGNLTTHGYATVTPSADGMVEVNHPGGGCWVGLTPDILPGDIVRITDANGVADQTTVANVVAGNPFQVDESTVVVQGYAVDKFFLPLPLDQIEQRLVNPDRFDNGRRTLRAPGEGTLAYDGEGSMTWTATYSNLSPADVEKALNAESRILWLGSDPAAGTELTIFEISSDLLGGPVAPCSAPSENPDLNSPALSDVPPAPAFITLNDPPQTPRQVIGFPSRDFISASGYGFSDVTVNVLRGGVTVGSAVVTPQDDPSTPVFDGIVEVNHPGGGCWVGATPDIRPGDIIRVTDADGVADQTKVANVIAERPIQIAFDTVVIHGSAEDADGNPLPLDQIEQRMIGSSADRFELTGRRDLRVPRDGTLAYDSAGSINWTATYTGLTSADVTRVFNAESRVLWLGSDPVVGTEITIFEIGDGTVNGPQTICSAQAEPSLSVAASVNTGRFAEAQSVTLSASETGSSIFYTTDGTTPTTLSAVYAGPIQISETTTLKFMATNMEFKSQVGRETYVIDDTPLEPEEPTTAPNAPSNLTATSTSQGQGNGAGRSSLSWTDNSTNEAGFEIQRSTSATTGFVLIATVGSNAGAYADTTGVSGTTYFFRVRAVNAIGSSDYSNTASVTVR